MAGIPRTLACANCAFWAAKTDDKERRGHCRKYAPRPPGSGDGFRTHWPVTLRTDVCGEHALSYEELTKDFQ